MQTIRCRICSIEKGESDFYVRKESGKRRTECKQCHARSSAEWAARNPDARKRIANKHARKVAVIKRDEILARRAIYRKRDPLRYHAWRINHPEKMQAARDKWDRENPDRKAAHAANRRSRQRNAIPKWSVPFLNRQFFHLARLRSQYTGVPHEVDHIVPLRGRTVCGLHVHDNLRVVPRRHNRVKGHFTWPDMP